MTTARKLCSARLERDMATGASTHLMSVPPTGSLNALLTGFDPNGWDNHRNL